MSRQRAVRFVRRPSVCAPPNPGLTVTAATSWQVNLSWTASAGAAGYKIYKDGPYLKSVAATFLGVGYGTNGHFVLLLQCIRL